MRYEFSRSPTATATASPTSIDKCPDEPEDKDGFQDEDGCPDPDNDNDGDGIPDDDDGCPDEPGPNEDDGCPDTRRRRDPRQRRQVPRRARPRRERRLPGRRRPRSSSSPTASASSGNILFETGRRSSRSSRTRCSTRSRGAARATRRSGRCSSKATPTTAARAPYNLDLSNRRAKSVANYLVSKGIDASACAARATGSTSPIATNDTPLGRAKNRRTEVPPHRSRERREAGRAEEVIFLTRWGKHELECADEVVELPRLDRPRALLKPVAVQDECRADAGPVPVGSSGRKRTCPGRPRPRRQCATCRKETECPRGWLCVETHDVPLYLAACSTRRAGRQGAQLLCLGRAGRRRFDRPEKKCRGLFGCLCSGGDGTTVRMRPRENTSVGYPKTRQSPLVSLASSVARDERTRKHCREIPRGSQRKAGRPVMCWPRIRVWTSSVPS